MEKAGIGIKRVKNACYENGNKCVFDFNDVFWITIHSNREDTLNDTLNDRENDILRHMMNNKYITQAEIASQCKVSIETIKRDIKKLQVESYIERKGSRKKGYWRIL